MIKPKRNENDGAQARQQASQRKGMPLLDVKNDDRLTENEKPLLRNNFIVMGCAALLIVLGFVLMTGSSSGMEEYNPDIFSTMRIVVGPLLCFIGFVLMAVGIIIKPKNTIRSKKGSASVNISKEEE